jgi:hypothetical protein
VRVREGRPGGYTETANEPASRAVEHISGYAYERLAVRCLRCRRPLHADVSIRRRSGWRCWRHLRAEVEAVKAA